MAKKLLCMVALLFAVVFLLASCDNSDNAPSTPENPAHTHAYGEWEIQKAATCTAEGSKDRYCSCGEKQTASISATGHSFGGWTTVKEASTTETGLKERTCSCGEKETQNIDMLVVLTTVTQSEWKNAFDLSTTDNFLFYIDELCTEVADEEVYGVNGTLTVQNGIIYRDIIEFWNDEEDVRQGYVAGVINNFFDISDFAGEWLFEFGSELNDYSDYGFSKFEYSESSKSYVASIDIDGLLCDISFCFENKQITKITISGRNNAMSLNCTYTFSYN